MAPSKDKQPGGIPSIVVWALVVVLVAVGVYLAVPTKGVMKEVAKADLAYAKELWSALEASELAGKSAAAAAPVASKPPHGPLVSTTVSQATVKGHTGTVAVQHNYDPKGASPADVAADPAKHLKSVNVMFKGAPGTNAKHNDWFWVKYDPSGAPAKDAKGAVAVGKTVSPCSDCHAQQKGQDYLFHKQN